MSSAVTIALSGDRTRAALRLFHPTGNIMTADMIGAVRAAIESASREPHLKLITIAGEGADFSYGASIPEHLPDQISRVLPLMHQLVEDILDAPAPTAAVVRGRCLGGGFELALACDFIFAADAAVFGLPEIALGVFPPAAAALLPARVGTALATRAILTGESRAAAAWQTCGLIDFVAPTGDLEAEVDRWFDRHLAGKSAAALRHAAAAARAGLLAHVRATLPDLERLYLEDLM
ncbi:MAG: enoyl-CoA hydratase/isomerase family protein, partial [Acidobacteria bacterium]|nr:enoyl-CoA hydratase/isomerase family protein [Acidobacteriota bacterium]